MLNSMPSGNSALRRTAAIVLLAFAAHCAHAMQVDKKSAAAAPLVIEGLGTGTVTLSGPWQFHPGDDPAWASPTFDSSGWEQLSADRPWGKQGHARLTGMAWYRCSISLDLTRGGPRKFALLVPSIHDSYEVYWNGTLIGHNGKLPPHPDSYLSQPVQVFELGQVQHGVLAIRVWHRSLFSDDSGEHGGFDAAPLIGSSQAIAAAREASEFQWLRSRQLHFGANLLCVAIAFLSFLLWLRMPSRWALFWAAGFAIALPVNLLLLNAHLGLSYSLAMATSQLVYPLQDVSLWFLLFTLFSLGDKRVLYRTAQILACVYFVIELADGVLVVTAWSPQWLQLAQICDAVLEIVLFPIAFFPLILVGYAFFQHKVFNSARWLLAVLVVLDQMLIVFTYTVKQGRQFTDWSFADKVDLPLFFVDGNGISLETLAGTLLLIAIVYAVYNSVLEDQRRQHALEREKMELLLESNRMRHHAEHDDLTGLWNHRMIVERLEHEMIRALREHAPLSVILADVDHFKRINDSFGHPAGDLVLKEIGKVFALNLRPYDSVGRYGGEEFLLVLPNCGIESALIRGEQLRAAIQSVHIMDGETLLQVTASFGVVSVLPSHTEAETVIRAVDAALYRAKNGGRNCVMQAEIDSPVCAI
ncbi:MAG TPA: GGDEF domain-containing protein [Terracidiphilus sp.]|nr:GGDEF domain-containing protein [Terracidiphilus sp.]